MIGGKLNKKLNEIKDEILKNKFIGKDLKNMWNINQDRWNIN